MLLTIQLPVDDEARLAMKAKHAGIDLPTYVERLLKAEMSKPALDEMLKPVRDAFADSGMSEDDLSVLLVKAKKEMRRTPVAQTRMSAHPISVVFDCMIYAQAMISRTGPSTACFDRVRSGELHLVWSDYVLQELRELPSKLPQRLKLTPDRVEAFIADVAPFAEHIAEITELYQNPFDADDSNYVNLAFASSANLITSRDGDLLRLMDLTRLEAREFSRRFPDLRILPPEKVLEILRRGE